VGAWVMVGAVAPVCRKLATPDKERVQNVTQSPAQLKMLEEGFEAGCYVIGEQRSPINKITH
jgi:hypothetical protein